MGVSKVTLKEKRVIVTTMKTCTTCKLSKSTSEFVSWNDSRCVNSVKCTESCRICLGDICSEFIDTPLVVKPSFEQKRFMFEQGFCYCNECKYFKPIAGFQKKNTNTFGYKSLCKTCYKLTPRYIKYNSPEYRRGSALRYRNSKAQCSALLGKSCMRCGYDEFITSLEFHHIDKSKKKYNISVMLGSPTKFSKSILEKELDKCILLCSNCHQAYEANQWAATFVKLGIGWGIDEHWICGDGN
ncbi:MAG: hypothetical protein GY928_33975 [Colwellia sp.]|nr:hypothetical protein [Colwellia sp.]